MRKMSKLFLLLLKRLSKKPSFIILLILVPVLSFSVSLMGKSHAGTTKIGLYFADDFGTKYYDTLTSYSDVLEFVIYDSKDQMLKDISKEKADCGFAFTENIEHLILSGQADKCISLYASPSTLLQGIAEEQIACAIFKIYSEHDYYDAVREEFGEEYLTSAKDLYNKYMTDSATFSIRYGTSLGDASYDIEVGGYSLNLKGILGLLIFLAGLNSLLLAREDIDNKRFITYCSNSLVTLANIISQVAVITPVVFLSLLFTGSFSGTIAKELLVMLLYLVIVILFCFVLGRIIRHRESLAVSIPIFTLMSLICCPVVIDISTYIPLFRFINKLFPLTYYLMFN